MEKVYKKEYLTKVLGLPYNSIEEEVVDQSRWEVEYKIVFEDEGKFYSTYYFKGATELQYVAPWEEDEEVICYEVEKKEVLVEKWVRKEE